MKQADGHGNRMTFVHKFIFRTKKLVGKMSGRAVSHHLVRPRSPCTSRSGGCRARAACPRPYAPTRSPTAMEDRRRATPIQSRQRTMPRHAHARRGRETERRIGAPPFLIFFWTVRLKPHDRNRLNARATQCRILKGSACSRTLRRPALSLDQTVQKKKIQGRHSTKERGTWASEPTP